MAKKPKKQLELEQRLKETTADLKRIQADFVNYKRRAEEDHTRAVSIGKEGTIMALLPTVDSLQRALEHVPKDLSEHDYVKGIQAVAKQLEKALSEMGVDTIDVVGKEFDPETMEAVMMDDQGGDKETVVEEMQRGYTLKGSVIRHAMVKVKKEQGK